MATVSTRNLKDQLSHYLQRAEGGEQVVVLRDGKPVAALVPLARAADQSEDAILGELAAQGLLTLPRRSRKRLFQRKALASPGKLASEMIVEDRR